MPFAVTQMTLEIMILSKIRERQILYDIAYMWNLKKKVQMNLQKKQGHRCKNLQLPSGKGGRGINWEIGIEYTLLFIKQV